jgi:transcriptional regulator with XRE-family HTH domain/DNA polymerase III delta prime subunit
MQKRKLEPNLKLKQARGLQGWTQKEVADKINDLKNAIDGINELGDVADRTKTLDERTIRRWEAGETIPNAYYSAMLCKLFKKSSSELGLVPGKNSIPHENGEQQHSEASQPSQKASDLSTRSTSSYSQRQRFLKKVRTYWIEKFLEPSLSNAVLLTLELHECPEAISNAWEEVTQLPDQPIHLFPSGTHITQIYDEARGELLILGEPGAGKTTLLLELTRDLLQRASEDEKHPIPIVFNLSSWSKKRAPLTIWLVEELNIRYHVPRRVAQAWIEHDHIIPLLDGLDEVNPTFRNACINAITAYHQGHGMVPLVVCSRKKEYMELAKYLQLQQAICIQPLTQLQIHEYIESVGEQAEGLQSALCDDEDLQKLATNALMLYILVSAYRDRSTEELKVLMTIEQRRKQLFTAYVESMFERRTPKHKQPYTVEQCAHGLIYLARQMQRHQNQTDFYLEDMQPDWLPTRRWQQTCYGLFIGLWAGLHIALLVGFMSLALGGTLFGAFVVTPWISIGVGLIAGIIGAMTESASTTLIKKIKKILIGMITGTIVGAGIIWAGNMYPPFENIRAGTEAGLVIGLVFLLLSVRKSEIQITKTTPWSWMQVQKNLTFFLRVVIPTSVGILIVGGWFAWNVADLGPKTVVIILLGLVSLLIGGLLSGFSNNKIERDEFIDNNDIFVKPNRGIHLSARSAIQYGFIASIVSGFILTAAIAASTLALSHLGFKIRFNAVLGALAIALPIGLVIGICNGGEASIKHILLRLMLWLRGDIPWNYVHFLDYASERILLRKIGGRYEFIHLLLRDYFASLEEQNQS